MTQSMIIKNKIKTYFSKPHNVILLLMGIVLTFSTVAPIIAIVEDTFRKVILKAGKFDAAYFDNGSQYVAKQLKYSLARLGITVRHAPVRSGKSVNAP